MHRALSTYLYVNNRLTTAWLDRIANAGIRAVEIYAAPQHLDYHHRGQIHELRHWFRDSELKLHSLHAPIFSDDVWGRSGPNAVVDISELTKARRIKAVDEVKRVLEIAESIPYRYLIQHIGAAGAEYDERKVDSTFSSLEELSVFASHRGVEVLIENTANELSSADRLLLFFEMTHLEMNICFDTGHANLRGSLENEFRLLKKRIRSTHVHDNDGKEDAHLFPGLGPAGTIDWKQYMNLHGTLLSEVLVLLELREVPDLAQPLDAVNQVFDRLEEMAAQNER